MEINTSTMIFKCYLLLISKVFYPYLKTQQFDRQVFTYHSVIVMEKPSDQYANDEAPNDVMCSGLLIELKWPQIIHPFSYVQKNALPASCTSSGKPADAAPGSGKSPSQEPSPQHPRFFQALLRPPQSGQ